MSDKGTAYQVNCSTIDGRVMMDVESFERVLYQVEETQDGISVKDLLELCRQLKESGK